MNKLLAKAIVAHGGLVPWTSHHIAKATALLSGDFCPTGRLDTSRQITVFPHLQRALVEPLGCPDCQSDLDHNRLSISRRDGTLITKIADISSVQMNFDLNGPTDQLLEAFLTCCTIRTFLTAPFLMAMEGVEINELVPWNEGGDQWRVLRAEFPAGLGAAARVQDFFFGGDFLLRRHDYHVDGDTGITITELLSDYVDRQGIKMPTKLRGYRRRSDLTPDLDRIMISIDLGTLDFMVG